MPFRSAQTVFPESISQAGSGGLVLIAGVVELGLETWAAGWWLRGAAILVALAGAALLARGLRTILTRPQPASREVRSAWPVEMPPAAVRSSVRSQVREIGGEVGCPS